MHATLTCRVHPGCGQRLPRADARVRRRAWRVLTLRALARRVPARRVPGPACPGPASLGAACPCAASPCPSCPGPACPGAAELDRRTIRSGSNWRSGRTVIPCSRAHSRLAPSAPLRSSGWRTVLRFSKAADSMSSKPTTDNRPGTPKPRRSAALSTPYRLGIRGGEDRCRRVGQPQQLIGKLGCHRRAVRSEPDQLRIKIDARAGELLPVSPQAAPGRAEAEVVLPAARWRRRRNRSAGGLGLAGARWPAARRLRHR